MRIMTLSLSLLLVTTSIASTGFPQTKESGAKKSITEWGTICEGFQLAVQTERQIFNPGEPVWLNVYLRNTSNNSASAFNSVPWMDYIIDIRNERGDKVSLTEEAKVLEQKQKDDRPIGFREMRLLPGQMFSDRLLLNKLYTINARGIYSVLVKRKIPKRYKKGWTEVTANVVKVTIGS